MGLHQICVPSHFHFIRSRRSALSEGHSFYHKFCCLKIGLTLSTTFARAVLIQALIGERFQALGKALVSRSYNSAMSQLQEIFNFLEKK